MCTMKTTLILCHVLMLFFLSCTTVTKSVSTSSLETKKNSLDGGDNSYSSVTSFYYITSITKTNKLNETNPRQ